MKCTLFYYAMLFLIVRYVGKIRPGAEAKKHTSIWRWKVPPDARIFRRLVLVQKFKYAYTEFMKIDLTLYV